MKILFGELRDAVFGNFACFINSRYIVDLSNVEFAAKKALNAWNSGKRISKSLAMEILLYYSATRQIEIARKLAGNKMVAAVVLDERKFSEVGFKERSFYPECDIELIKEHYQILEEELRITGIEKLPLLIRERIALFSVFGE
jgi:KEOPS complex subunit Cgi121